MRDSDAHFMTVCFKNDDTNPMIFNDLDKMSWKCLLIIGIDY